MSLAYRKRLDVLKEKLDVFRELEVLPHGSEIGFEIGKELYTITKYKVGGFYLVTLETIESMGKHAIKTIKKELPHYFTKDNKEITLTNMVKEHYKSKDVKLESLIPDIISKKKKFQETQDEGLFRHRFLLIPQDLLAKLFADLYMRSDEGKNSIQEMLEYLVAGGDRAAYSSLDII
jgi:hypothetical protein